VGLRLYDTSRREIVPFEPPPTVRMYVCGITPYDSTHLGHAATYINYDILIRRLEDLGHEVRMVRNITDVDDSILPKARELGVDYLELAAQETARFQGDMAALGMRPPIAEPRATESVPQIIELVGQLLDKGHAYISGGSVYFDVSTFPDFGKLSHYPEDRMIKQIDQQIADTKVAMEGANSLSATEEATDVNPLRSSLEAELAKNESNSSGLRARSAMLAKQLIDYQRSLGTLRQDTPEDDRLLREIKETEDNFFLYSKKREEARIAEAMVRLGRDASLNLAMGRAAYEAGARNNSWQDYSDRLIAEYARRRSMEK